MKSRTGENSCCYEKSEHWPPYTYREFPSATTDSLRSFLDFLDSENSNHGKSELQPWIPFCDTKCTFCWFPTELISEGVIEKYLLALKKSLSLYAQTRYVRTSSFNEIYLGGGTPTLLSSKQLCNLLSWCKRNFNMNEDNTIKVTGCTHGLDKAKMESMFNFGVDQLDLGVQTFDDHVRKMLNLSDTAHEAMHVIKTARRLGLRVSIDLIYNLPGQTLEVWREDVEKALTLNVESVDCYPLDVNNGTALARQIETGRVPRIGDLATEKKMYSEAYSILKEAGYRPTCHNRFSRVPEDFKEPCSEILGSGAAFFMGHLGRYSYMDVESTERYIDLVNNGKLPIDKLSRSSEEEEMRKMMMRLYMRLPVNKEEFKRSFGRLPEEVFHSALERLKAKRMIEADDREIRLTRLGDMWRVQVAWEFTRD